MNNMCSLIKQYNCKVVSTKNLNQLCNCRNKESWPLNGKCLQTCIVCKVDVITNKDGHIYFGGRDGEFKSRLNNHTNSFYYWHGEQDTDLSKHIWQLKKHQLYPKMEYCSLCLDMQMWTKKVWPSFNREYIIERDDQKYFETQGLSWFQDVAIGVNTFSKILNSS